MVGLLLAAAISGGQTQPPALTAGEVYAAGRMLQTWRATDVRCGDATLAFAVPPRSAGALAWGAADLSVGYRFRIDATGRPLGITRSAAGYRSNADDLAPALAAARFAAGSPHDSCSLSFAATRVPIADAPVEPLMAYSLDSGALPLPQAGWDRINGGANCAASPRPEPLLRAYPPSRSLPATPGVRDWSMVGYDLDQQGRPIGARTVAGTGNVALDRASVDAVRRSRFTAGARVGCLYPYWRAAGTLTAPEPPPEASMRPADATCPEQLPFLRQPARTTPLAWNRRNIEGWAVVAYDVAPWGGLGNIRVLAAEPSAEFGDWAMKLLEGATKAASAAGYTGCVDRIRFRVGDKEPVTPEMPPIF